MSAYFNEIDPFAAEWLRNLIKAGLIADGEVDTRSIVDVRPVDLQGFVQCHFFAGVGVWSYAARQAGWSDDRPIWTGSCPCQPFSGAGRRGGFDDERHLWPVFYGLIRECLPAVVFGEQVASADGLAWLDAVHADMEASRYAFGAADMCAASLGAPHIRQRLWWVGKRLEHAESDGRIERRSEPSGRSTIGGRGPDNPWANAEWLECRDGRQRPIEPGLEPLAHGIAGRVGRLRAYGNAIVAPVATAFIEAVMEAS